MTAQNTVNDALTPNGRKRRERSTTENPDYAAFLRRIVAAYARRVANGDVEALPDMLAVSRQLDDAITQAVAGLRRSGYSWAEIAARLGVTRQAAHQRWSAADHLTPQRPKLSIHDR